MNNSPRTTRPSLYGATIEELRDLAEDLGAPRHTATQISEWLYRHHADSFEEMSNLKKSVREELSNRYGVAPTKPERVTEDPDGTRKYLFETESGHLIETAVIPQGSRLTLCLSSQAGCARGCRFCATAAQGLQANLSVRDILNQYRSIPERDGITNIVFMGMGEPLDNVDAVMTAIRILTEPWGYGMSSRRITLSTSGGRTALERVLAETSVHIAVSVHTPFPDERAELVPGERAFPLQDTLDLLASTPRSSFRKVTLEYVVLPGANDSRRHAEALAKRSRSLGATINVIPYNPTSPEPIRAGTPGRAGTPARADTPQPAGDPVRAAEQFTALLADRGAAVTLRRSRGQRIAAACGMLSTAAYRQRRQPSPTSTPGA